MVTRIHPEITEKEIPEYNPFEDEKVVDLGPHDKMSVKQALIVTYQANLKNVVTIGETKDGNGTICTYSEITAERLLFMLEKMKSIVIEGGMDEYDPKNAG